MSKKRKNSNCALSSPDLIFARSFRWNFKAAHLPEYFVRKVRIDHINKIICLEIYQAYGNEKDTPFQEWIKNWDDEATFTCYDGCGDELDETKFTGLKLIAHTGDYDYASSDVATDDVIVSYETESRACSYLRTKMPKIHVLPKGDEGKLIWKLLVDDEEYVVEDQKRPNLVVEEIEIPYKNQTIWIPGRAKWESASFKIKTKDPMDDLHKKDKCTLRLYIGEKLVEEWKVSDIMTNSIDRSEEGQVNWTIHFASVSYQAA